MPSFRRMWIVLLLLPFTMVSTKLSCTFSGLTKQVCKTSDQDNILARGIVSDNNRTREITLRECRITDVELESFENLPALKYIDLSRNKIRKLELGVLDQTKRVTHLNLSYNLLVSFPLGLFDEKPNLEVIDLKGNNINFIELGLFDKSPKLKHVDLSSNELVGEDFSAYVFDKSVQITFLDFSRNNMRDSPENLLHAFTMLEFLNLDRCSLKEVPSFATQLNLRTLKHLMLSTNQISKVINPATFVNMDSLEIINLAYNVIEEIHGDVFTHLKNLKKVVLRNNRLKQIPDTLFQNINKINAVDLSHNLIESIPVEAFTGTHLSFLNLANNRFTYLKDNFSLELRNHGVRLTKFFFNQNPWQCECLLDVLNEVKKYNIAYNGVKYNGIDAVCVVSDYGTCQRQPSINDYYAEKYDDLTKSNN